MDIEAVIAAVVERYDADEAAVIEEYLRNYHGNVPDKQLIEEAALAVVVYRRRRS